MQRNGEALLFSFKIYFMTKPNDPINVIDGMYASDAIQSDNTGLTKREHFAAMAMQGLLSGRRAGIYEFKRELELKIAELSVNIADDLIKALNRKS